jgi:Flp pilus assembly pilin Flp
MFNFIKNFKRDEDGAVTVDFVVVTAAVVGLGIAVLATLTSGVKDVASTVNTEFTTGAKGFVTSSDSK